MGSAVESSAEVVASPATALEPAAKVETVKLVVGEASLERKGVEEKSAT